MTAIMTALFCEIIRRTNKHGTEGQIEHINESQITTH